MSAKASMAVLQVAVAYAWCQAGSVISQVIGAPLAAGLLALDGVGNLDGWQWLFLAEGIPTLAFGMCGNLDPFMKP